MIGIARHIEESLAHRLMRLGIREYLVAPVTRTRLLEVLDFLQKQLAKHPRPAGRPGDLYTFFPAKPGVGCTTIALSASCALAEELSVRTLLMDCDLAAGIVKFHLKLRNSGSVLDAMGHAESLDQDMWRQMIGSWGKLEVLHAGTLMSPPPINLSGLGRVLTLARAQYEVICADLPSSLDDLSTELLRESQRIFLVTTPEVAAVHLARVRVGSLKDLGLLDRVSLVLNRKDHWKGHLEAATVAEAAGIPIAYTIGNDYPTCSEAIVKGSSISGATNIGRCIMNLAHSLRADASQPAPAGMGRKFLEFFRVSPVEDPTTVWRD
jgi:pilus assembly protein CpaE